MIRLFLLAWMSGWYMSARLAKLSTENGFELIDSVAHVDIIIDMDNVGGDEFQKVSYLLDEDLILIIGYARELDGSKIKRFRRLGFDMVLRCNKLLKNLTLIQS